MCVIPPTYYLSRRSVAGWGTPHAFVRCTQCELTRAQRWRDVRDILINRAPSPLSLRAGYETYLAYAVAYAYMPTD